MSLNLKSKPKHSKPSPNRRARERFGRLAEFIAALWLQLQGYTILKRRFKNPLGEIDLIAKHKGTLVFIEVKARQSLELGLTALTPFQQQRLKKGARFYLAKHNIHSLHDLRFDYVIISKARIHHLKNAF